MALHTNDMFRTLRRLFRRFLRFFGMASEPPRIRGLFTRYELDHDTMDVGPWHDLLRSQPAASDCFVTKVGWYKKLNWPEHEFLQFEVSSPDKKHTSIVVVERTGRPNAAQPIDALALQDTAVVTDTPLETMTPPHTPPEVAVAVDAFPDVDASPASSADERSPSAGKRTKKKGKFKQATERAADISTSISPDHLGNAHDRVLCATLDSTGSTQLEKAYENSSHICTLTFSEKAKPSASDLAILVYVTSTLEPKYDLHQTQCYWFAATVFEALKSLFESAEQDTLSRRAGTTYRMRIARIKDSVKPVCDRYKEAQATLAEEIEQKRKAEQQPGQQEEERRQERAQRVAAEEAAKREREQRQAAEEERHREREQRQAAEERARAAEEERQRERQAAEEEIAKLQRELEALRKAGASTQQV
ncbi:hypothetical protein EDC04DRAFT_2893821 [Pisolithus marmoratus]|nr:hypothetical protein EDC04DRAFT_2893821 [Pisolithus marmoratus]